jgi:hypothetical protein
MSGLIPNFSMRDINARIDRFEKEKTRKMFEVLSYVGIESVKFAKKYHGYRDQTGNLTSSIGYAIIHDGKIESTYGGGTAIVQKDISGKTKRVESTTVGKSGAVKVIEELARQYPRGMVLVVVAGMEYAAAVESKSYDVITGSSMYADTELLPFMKERLGIQFS